MRGLKHLLGMGAMVVVSFQAVEARGAAINIQFGIGVNNGTQNPYVGTAAAASATGGGTPGNTDSGTVWNDLKAASGTATTYSDGSAILGGGVAVTVAKTGTYSNASGANGTPSYLLADYVDSISATPSNYSLTNVPAGTYDVYIYGINGSYQSRGTRYTVNGAPGTQTTNNTTYSSFIQNNNYVVFDAVTVADSGNGFGTLSGTYLGVPSTGTPNNTEGDVNAIQLVPLPAPEPASLAVLGLGGLGLLLRRRRS